MARSRRLAFSPRPGKEWPFLTAATQVKTIWLPYGE